jgi:hypothetical protein
MMQLKDAHLAKDCENDFKSKYITGGNIDSKVQPLCANPLSVMKANDQNDSSLSFSVIKNSHWVFYNDSKQKFGWILDIPKTMAEKLCFEKVFDFFFYCICNENNML